MRRLAITLLLVAAPLGAQVPTGYGATSGARERAMERAAMAIPDPARAAAHAKLLSAEPHVSGTPVQARTRDYVIEQMKAMGLETEVRAYDIWMPHPTSVRAWRVAPEPRELDLREGALPQDSTLGTLPEVLPINGYGGAGDVTGEVVYVNYGLIEDYAQLAAAGVSVQGKVAVARYGRSFRGIKAREAEKHGALALLIYSDPQDDGYVQGDVYPEGPMRPAHAIQRGSVYNGNGDPSTPGWPSVAGARRLTTAELNVPRIPVVPISYGNAAELLRGVRGAAIPRGWQGGLPFRYHVGPGPVKARVAVATDTATRPYKTIWDTFGIIRGSELPDEMILIGAHRDAWGPGTGDNVSGTVSVLEAARAVAEQVKQGNRPRRTLVFATWDAEEWGLIGSSEYVEDDSLRLLRGAVAYLNQDGAASGSAFGGGGSPSLRAVLRDVVRQVDDPKGGGSIYDAWRRAARLTADSLEPPMGDPGGGSDFAGFYNHLGIPHSEWGFGGAGGVYHSMYDSYAWMQRFGDVGYTYHAVAARIGAAMLLRLANADVIPYDYVEFARTMRRYVAPIDSALATRGAGTAAELSAAIDGLESAARRFTTARDAALASSTPAPLLQRANRALLGVERALTRPEGLRSRPWFRNLIYAADEDNGYANMVFPSVNEALRRRDDALTKAELSDLASRFGAASRALDQATAALTR